MGEQITVTCITLHRPWAAWVAAGLKPIETRLHDKFKSLAGKWVGIHAGKHFDAQAFSFAVGYEGNGALLLAMAKFERKGVLCFARVQEARWLTGKDSAGALIDCEKTRRFGLVFGEVVEALDRPEMRLSGAQGMWKARLPVELIPAQMQIKAVPHA